MYKIQPNAAEEGSTDEFPNYFASLVVINIYLYNEIIIQPSIWDESARLKIL